MGSMRIRKYWNFSAKVIFGFILGVVGTVLLSAFITSINLFIDKTMSDLVFATGIMAFGTIILAGASFWTIRQNYNFRNEDRKERLLNEIIEWAINVAKCGIEPNTPDLSEDFNATKAWPFLGSQEKKLDILQLLRAQSKYIIGVAQGIDSSLQKAAYDTTEGLRAQLKAIYEYKNHVEQYKAKKVSLDVNLLRSKATEASENNIKLYSFAVKLLEEAAKLKIENIK